MGVRDGPGLRACEVQAREGAARRNKQDKVFSGVSKQKIEPAVLPLEHAFNTRSGKERRNLRYNRQKDIIMHEELSRMVRR
jgi:hypothetical protein